MRQQHPITAWVARPSPAKSRILQPAPEVKVLCFFLSGKKTLLFLKKKKQKDFYSCAGFHVRLACFCGRVLL
jgi:hypothetical protein